MKKILFVNPGPFGNLTDTYFYYLNLKDIFDITYIGFDEGGSYPFYDQIEIVQIKGNGNAFRRKVLFLKEITKLLKGHTYHYIHINYFLGCSFINLLNKNNNLFNIDVRTGIISENKYKVILLNIILSFEVSLFRHFTCISESLKEYLKLPNSTSILPLGAPQLPLIRKDFNVLKLLYVGTFRSRNIVNTILGFAMFIAKNDKKFIAQYTIIGFGTDDEIKEINDAITENEMENYIFFRGTIRYPELISYFNESNVGISYIPIIKCFDNQPPTKTFEYLLSGMFVLATATKENKKVINNQNGFLIGDSIDDFCRGLQYTYENRHLFNSIRIQQESRQYSWENIVKTILYPYIENYNSFKTYNDIKNDN